MDTIEFKIVNQKYGYKNENYDLVEIFINGKNFLDTVKEFDKSYSPIIPEYLYTDLIDGYKDYPIFIYDCGCGCSGCDPFCVFVDVGEKTVTWYDFMTEEEYFDDVCKDNNFAMLKERLKNEGGLPPLVFDKKQYFDAVGFLRDWIFDEKFNIKYGGIDCGYLELNFISLNMKEKFIFDELLSAPIPQLVELFNYIQKCIEFDKNFGCQRRGSSIGYKFETNLPETYDDRITAIKISAEHYDLRNILNFEIPDKNFSCRQTYLCVEWTEMFKKLFSDLINDKYFPYSYPCFWYICEDTDDKIFDDFEEKIEKLYPDCNIGDVINYGVAEGKFSLLQENKIFLKKYEKMLTDYIIPETWF